MTEAAEDLQPAGAAPALEHGRTRKCIVSGDVLPEARLLRFVADPEGRVVVDVEAKLPGRGMWLRSERAAVQRAVEKRLFSRAAKLSLTAGSDLAEQAEARLSERMLAQLGLAHRAGQLILGFDTVEKALRSATPPALVIEASDAAADGMRKLQAAAVASGLVPYVIGCFSSAELSLALGRANVIHAALKPGRMAERLIFEAGRLSGFRPLQSWTWVGFSEGRAASGAGPLV
jgi:uncharacterized protein